MLRLAREAGEKGGTAPCVFNAANEVAVAAFLESRLTFLGIAEVVEAALMRSDPAPARDLDDLLEADRSARVLARRETGGRMTWLVVAVGLLLLIFLHELGHFGAALAVGNRPRGFYVGFGPKLASFTRNGIEYGLRAIPAGGYVRLPGMHRPAARDIETYMGPALREQPGLAATVQPIRRALDAEDFAAARALLPALRAELATAQLTAPARRSANRAVRDVDDGTSSDAYWRQPPWKRIVVIAAGPAMNILVAFVIFFAVYATGAPSQNLASTTVAGVASNSPAAKAGLQVGDKLVAVNGHPAKTFDRLSALIRASHGRQITVTVDRAGKTLTLGPEATTKSGGRWVFGFNPAARLVSYPLAKSARLAADDCRRVFTGTVSAFGGLFHKKERGQSDERRRDREGLERGPARRLQLLPADRRLRQHVARAAEPAAVPAARRRPHRVLAHRGGATPQRGARGLRADLGRRLCSDHADLLHRAEQRRRPLSPRLNWPQMASERQITVGGVAIGGGAPVVVQSMTLTKTHDVEATTAQIAALASAGCEIVRVAVPKLEDAEALPRIVRLSPIPVIADIHFNASLALKAIEGGVAAVRINPGNIGGPDKVALVVRAAKKAGIPMRIGANSGSLPKHLSDLAQQDQAEALVEAALEEVRLLESLDFRDFKISVKSSHVPTMIRAYRPLSEQVPYPIHLGVTEAGTPFSGSIKSAVGMGALLVDGIGDTLRVSLTADPVEEIKTAFEILKALGLRERGPIMIACPSCGRDNVGVQTLAEKVEARLAHLSAAFRGRRPRLRRQRPGRGGRRRLRHRRRPRRRLRLRARPRAEEGQLGHPDRRALLRDRQVDRRRHAAPEAAQDGEAGGACDGRSVADSARVACPDNG